MGKLCPRDSVRQIKSVNKSLTKKLLCFLGGALVLSTGVGQKIQPLTIGDTLPDIALNNIINYKTTSARLSDFRDKPVDSAGC